MAWFIFSLLHHPPSHPCILSISITEWRTGVKGQRRKKPSPGHICSHGSQCHSNRCPPSPTMEPTLPSVPLTWVSSTLAWIVWKSVLVCVCKQKLYKARSGVQKVDGQIRRVKGKSLRVSALSERLTDRRTESHWSMCEQLCIKVRVFVRGKCEVMVPLGEAQHSLMLVHWHYVRMLTGHLCYIQIHIYRVSEISLEVKDRINTKSSYIPFPG